MSVLPTVRIVNPAAPRSFVIINESDFVDGVHERWSAAAVEPLSGPEMPYPAIVGDDDAPVDGVHAEYDTTLPLCIVKGPRGRWYVKRGPMIVGGKNAFESPGFEGREDAEAALNAMGGGQ